MPKLTMTLRKELNKCFAFVTDVNAPDFDESFVVATAVNPQLIGQLTEPQLDCAKLELKRMVSAEIFC